MQGPQMIGANNREMQGPQVIGYFNPEMIQALEDIINKEFLLSDRSGKAMYNIWLLNENRRIACLFAGGENVVLEEQIAEALENHNRYHKTTYTRKDVSVVREDPDDTIELAKAKWRIDFLLRTLDRMETEIVGLQLNLKSANDRLMNVSPAVLSGAKSVAEEVLQKVNGHFARLHFISPNTPLVQLTRDDKEELLRSYVLPRGERGVTVAPVSVETVYAPGLPAKSM